MKIIKNLIGKVVTGGRAERGVILSWLPAFVLSVQDGSTRDRPVRFFDLIPLTWQRRGATRGPGKMLDGRAGRRVLRSFAPVLWFREDGGATTGSGRPLLFLVTHQKKPRGSIAPFCARILLPNLRDPAGPPVDHERRVTV